MLMRRDPEIKEWTLMCCLQYGGSPVKVGEEEFHLFRDHEYV